ncbi:uncharacterized protein LOC127240228 [Andrographis paniculata]|uniref:uncharacterized protein LOC127240228 n=1 Tax=Andrographis paniculata TaxID=175694 RepID=UPI0021E7344B|nr:uncharacterized protein LOC127240228 [Andrographis paniculata]
MLSGNNNSTAKLEKSEMDAAPPPPPPSQSASTPAPAETEDRDKEIVHRTKAIQFLGRTTPIILQNDNGPCPLLAICNVLSLKNSLNLSPDIPEVSQEKLLSLVAERLIDSNSSVDNKDTGYVENQQQNIADAIDLLPRLSTGIDVNIKFRRIDDFEFTPECAIFDLLDIPLYHGWIVDPQDYETTDAIGSKSYNTLMGELVSLETQNVEDDHKKNTDDGDDDDVDFVAATTAALGVPSPSLSRGQSFDESPHKPRKGDVEEEALLLKVLKISEAEGTNPVSDGVSDDISFHVSPVKEPELITHMRNVEDDISKGTTNTPSIAHADVKFPEAVPQEVNCSFSKIDQENSSLHSSHKESLKVGDAVVSDTGTKNGKVQSSSVEDEVICDQDNSQDKLRGDELAQNDLITTLEPDEPRNQQNGGKEKDTTDLLAIPSGPDSASGHTHNTEDPQGFPSNVDNNEPIYEGEECILDSGHVIYENREPVYEGEVVLAEQADKSNTEDGGLNGKEIISAKQGEIIRNFLNISASQLTVYGLFCLQDRVKERELCVFFRNNHFNTMFKYEGELYILVTDQGYINQPDLVWEKLNEVNGDSVYMTGDFKEFKMDDNSNNTWNEQNAMDYLAGGIDTTQENSTFNSDLQLAMALQQQEYEQQQQQQNQRNLQQPAVTDGSKMVTGPRVSHNGGRSSSSSSSSKQQESPKAKERCILM